MNYTDLDNELYVFNSDQKKAFETCMALITRIAIRLEERGFSIEEIADFIGCDMEELLDIVAFTGKRLDLHEISENFVRIEGC